MILGFKPRFEGKIAEGTKVHTIREDKKNRWTKGRTIHFAVGVRTKAYRQIGTGVCTSVQAIKINKPYVTVDNRPLTLDEINELAIRDGFTDVDAFFEWFSQSFEGKLIHWTEFKY